MEVGPIITILATTIIRIRTIITILVTMVIRIGTAMTIILLHHLTILITVMLRRLTILITVMLRRLTILITVILEVTRMILGLVKTIDILCENNKHNQMSCHLPKPCAENPYVYSRAELVAIAEACGITGIAKKNMNALCAEITEHIGRRGPAPVPLPLPLPPVVEREPVRILPDLDAAQVRAIIQAAVAVPQLAQAQSPQRAQSPTRAPARRGTRSTRADAGCTDHSHLAKYRERPSPPYPANECCGEVKQGNDGHNYESVPDRNGVCRWRRMR